MARKSVINRNNKRLNEILKHKAVWDQLREDVSNIKLSEGERWEAMIKRQKISRKASPVQYRHRCKLCGRPRGYNRRTGLCRLHMRIATINGMVPGMRKASW